jgi:ATP-dependent DNA helicase RecQ
MDTPAREQAAAVLKRYWGYTRFRNGQAEVIEAVLARRDVLAILPTGGGKSLCYQVPALMQDGLTLVISPLIALMQDQVTALQARRIPAAFINSTLSAHEVEQRWTDAEFGRYRLLYLAPERLSSDLFLARAERLKVTLLVVDEAHCISEWGYHFRPAYLQIAAARTLLQQPPVLAVTATAPPEVRQDICTHLALQDPLVLVQGFDRPNLVWSIFSSEHKQRKVRDVLRTVAGCGVLYTATRRGVEQWAAWLTRQGESVAAYHGGMTGHQRAETQAAWLAGTKRMMVATNAFGMGIDKPDVRFVIHVDLPGTLEGYYQEAGRAGRDGQKAYAVLLYNDRDETTQRALLDEAHPDAHQIRKVYDAVCNLNQIALGTRPDAPVPLDLEVLVRLTGLRTHKIRTALELLVRQGTWQEVPPKRHEGFLRFLQPADALRHYADGLTNRALATFVHTLLRTVHADAYAGWWEMDLRLIEGRTQLPRARLLRGFAFLAERGLLQWRAPGGGLQVVFNAPRSRPLPIDDRQVRLARRRAEVRLADLLRYAHSDTCRRHFLLTYFGEASPEHCGACDVCLGRHHPPAITPADEPLLRHLLHQIAAGQPPEAWFNGRAPAPHRLDALLDYLVQQGYLHVPNPLHEHFLLTEQGRARLDD